MSYYILNEELYFPPLHRADSHGILALGGDLSVERLLLAYKSGIFPWFSENEPIVWWSPDPRFVLFPEKLKISKSMRPIFNQNIFEFTFDKAFEEVILACKTTKRKGQYGTWITEDMLEAYNTLHQLGFAHSVEVWKEGDLLGGLYGISIGKIFFGESMFSKVSNASKAGFIYLVRKLKEAGVHVIDCQVHTQHLESLGAEMIPRTDFVKLLKEGLIERDLGEFWKEAL